MAAATRKSRNLGFIGADGNVYTINRLAAELCAERKSDPTEFARSACAAPVYESAQAMLAAVAAPDSKSKSKSK